ncbi:MAG: 3-deoxy-D-manno-octulosonate 8-phosphate phosphatase (KDO 8-P phosphatase) [Gammaproteobacteria bacterium]
MSDKNKAIDKASAIKLAVFDVDGVMTDGRLIYTKNQEEHKIFHVHDGLGLQMLKKSGCEIAIVSSRSSDIVLKRMNELNIDIILQGQSNKRETVLTIVNKLNLNRSNVAYTGDDILDIPAMGACGLAIAVANAHPLVKKHADWITEKSGGAGAVREICELILSSQGKLESINNNYII